MGHQWKRSETLTKATDPWFGAGMASVLSQDRNRR